MKENKQSKETTFELRNVDDLIPYARNARTHSPEQIQKLAGSIKEFGFLNPVVISEDGGILAGHGRVMAAQKLGIKQVPCVVESHLTEAQKKAYILADNRLALDAGWDEEMLKIEISELKDVNFNLDLIGFDGIEIDEILNEQLNVEKPTDSEAPDYVSFGESIQYEPTGRDVSISDCCDVSKYDELAGEIEKSELPDDIKLFLMKAATRHIIFNYRNIAEYYASKASPEMQRLMEKSALVLIDYDDAVKNGLVILSKKLEELRISQGTEEYDYE